MYINTEKEHIELSKVKNYLDYLVVFMDVLLVFSKNPYIQ